jgi:hypothetical protein
MFQLPFQPWRTGLEQELVLGLERYLEQELVPGMLEQKLGRVLEQELEWELRRAPGSAIVYTTYL